MKAASDNKATGSTIKRWVMYEATNERFQAILNDLDDKIIHLVDCEENATDEGLVETLREQVCHEIIERAQMAVQLYLMETDLTLAARHRFQREQHLKMAMEMVRDSEERAPKAAGKKAAPRKRRAKAHA